ncbi:hypothetical protein [Anabaena sp. CCY 0017]
MPQRDGLRPASGDRRDRTPPHCKQADRAAPSPEVKLAMYIYVMEIVD